MKKTLLCCAMVLMSGMLALAQSRIYFDNSVVNWATPMVHYWGGTSASTWPGEAMTLCTGSVYYFDCPAGTTGLVFNDGNGTQTNDLNFVASHLYQCTGSRQQSDLGAYTGAECGTVAPNPEPEPDPDPIEPDTTLVPGETHYPSLNNQYYQTNPDGQVGTNRTINMSIGNGRGVSTSALSTWTQAELIATGAANDEPQMFRGGHEYPFYDAYALYAAYDDNYLYLGCQYVNVYNGDKGNCKPYAAEIPICIALDLNPNKDLDGTMASGDPTPWNLANTFHNGMDALVLFAAKVQTGTPGLFLPNAQGKFSYNAPYCLAPDAIAYQDGLLPSIEHIYGKPKGSYAYPVGDLTTGAGFVDNINTHSADYHTFYEVKLSLSKLGITKSFIQNVGIGVMWISTYGESAMGSIPYDATTYDNVMGQYGKDPSTSHEKDDADVFTYAMARVGKLGNNTTAVGNVSDANNALIYGLQGQLRIENATAPITLYTLTGETICTLPAQNTQTVALSQGLYIVKVGNQVEKVMIP